jgi:predicted transcriptional regulator
MNNLCYIVCMDTSKLVATGLTDLQAQAYALLIEKGSLLPPVAASELNISRTNAYKLLDKMVELGLAQKNDSHKKTVYTTTNPQALTRLVADQRNQVARRENAVRDVLAELMAKYRQHADQPDIQAVSGRESVAAAYRSQSGTQQPIYFLRSPMDIAVMGFETMHEIRIDPARFDQERLGITPDIAAGTTNNPASDERSNLTRTWARQEDYDAPVEWSVSGTQLLIVLFTDEPHAITIDNPMIADAFRQIWMLLNSCLRAMPYYKELPR